MNIYVVTTGAHYELQIHGVFADGAKARLLADALPDSNGIDVWTLDKLHPQIEAGLKPYQVQIENHETEPEDVWELRANLCDMDDADQQSVWDYNDDSLYVHCWAKDGRAAIEQAFKIRQEWLEKQAEAGALQE